MSKLKSSFLKERFVEEENKKLTAISMVTVVSLFVFALSVVAFIIWSNKLTVFMLFLTGMPATFFVLIFYKFIKIYKKTMKEIEGYDE